MDAHLRTPGSAYLRSGYEKMKLVDASAAGPASGDFPPNTPMTLGATPRSEYTHAPAAPGTEWVTVFGLPVSYSRDGLLRVLAGFGSVSELQPVSGNWVNVRFTSPIAAANALSAGRALLAPGVMIGFCPHVSSGPEKEDFIMTPVKHAPDTLFARRPLGARAGVWHAVLQFVFGWA